MSILGTIIQKSAKIGAKVNAPRRPAAELQEQQLLELLREARFTAFGLEYGFHEIMMADDPIAMFKKVVPATDYDGIYDRWWSKAHLEDAPDVCWPGVVPYYALSSGTSQAASKYIPITEDLLRGMKRGFRRLFFDLNNYDIPASQYTKQMLMIGACTQLERQGNHWEGDFSGIIGLNRPFVMERSYRPGRHITNIPEWGDRIELIAEEAKTWDIGFSACSPMWLQLVLERIIEKNKIKHIHELWPNFSLIVHGGVLVGPYKATLEQLFGQPMHFVDSYTASEGFFGYQQHPENSALKLLSDCGIFFEFVPFNGENFDEDGDLLSDQPQSLRVEEVTTDVDYVMLLSSTAGAWRYMLGDTIRFTNAEQKEFKITGRTKQFLSACGEHLSIDNLSAAVLAADKALNAGIREFAVAAVRDGTYWAHQWYVSMDNKSVSSDALGKVLDAELGRLNDDYRTERRYALRELRVKILPNDTFISWLNQRGKLNGQAKIPRVLKGANLKSFESFISA